MVPKEWVAPPDFDTADGELLEAYEDEEDEEDAAMLGKDRKRAQRRLDEGGGEEGTPPPRLVSLTDTSGRQMPGAERAPVPGRKT